MLDLCSLDDVRSGVYTLHDPCRQRHRLLLILRLTASRQKQLHFTWAFARGNAEGIRGWCIHADRVRCRAPPALSGPIVTRQSCRRKSPCTVRSHCTCFSTSTRHARPFNSDGQCPPPDSADLELAMMDAHRSFVRSRGQRREGSDICLYFLMLMRWLDAIGLPWFVVESAIDMTGICRRRRPS